MEESGLVLGRGKERGKGESPENEREKDWI